MSNTPGQRARLKALEALWVPPTMRRAPVILYTVGAAPPSRPRVDADEVVIYLPDNGRDG